MTFQGFEGPAGSGKTYQLVAAVRAALVATPLQSHQRILALTFMHGSRRRLEDRFRRHAETRQAVCMTIDSFAGTLVDRWIHLVPRRPDEGDFDGICDAAGALLEQESVAKWVAATFPVVAIDEAQELKPCRLRIAQALARFSQLFVAADEYQCLDSSVDTRPFQAWFSTGNVTTLTTIRRTDKAGLLDAAGNIRNQQRPGTGDGFAIRYVFPNGMRFAIGYSLMKAKGSTAIIHAPIRKTWPASVVKDMSEGFSSKDGKRRVAALPVAWESRPDDEVATFLKKVCPRNEVEVDDLLKAIEADSERPHWHPAVAAAVRQARRCIAKTQWSADELMKLFGRKAANHRAYASTMQNGIPMMSIPAAKNREFDHVVVLWGAGVQGDADYQRRLLYNAITRAQLSCTVFVQVEELLQAAPFV